MAARRGRSLSCRAGSLRGAAQRTARLPHRPDRAGRRHRVRRGRAGRRHAIDRAAGVRRTPDDSAGAPGILGVHGTAPRGAGGRDDRDRARDGAQPSGPFRDHFSRGCHGAGRRPRRGRYRWQSSGGSPSPGSAALRARRVLGAPAARQSGDGGQRNHSRGALPDPLPVHVPRRRGARLPAAVRAAPPFHRRAADRERAQWGSGSARRRGAGGDAAVVLGDVFGGTRGRDPAPRRPLRPFRHRLERFANRRFVRGPARARHDPERSGGDFRRGSRGPPGAGGAGRLLCRGWPGRTRRAGASAGAAAGTGRGSGTGGVPRRRIPDAGRCPVRPLRPRPVRAPRPSGSSRHRRGAVRGPA